MALQLQINIRPSGEIMPNDLDRLVYELSQLVQSRIPCKVFGYGAVEIVAPENSRFTSELPATAEAIKETAAPLRMAAGLSDALL
jgi:hypothetical protein